MKFSQFKKEAENIAKRLNIPVGDLDLEISLDPLNSLPEDHLRYQGKILELMDDNGSIKILAEGSLNEEDYNLIKIKPSKT